MADDERTYTERAQEIAEDDSLTDLEAIKQLLVVLIDVTDLAACVMMGVDDKLDMRKVTKQ